MDPDRHQRLSALFRLACDLSPDERTRFLDRECAADDELRAEVEALLDPQRRWQTTFSSYFTKLSQGIECQWRFVLEGSKEAVAATRLANTLVLNLCEPLEIE